MVARVLFARVSHFPELDWGEFSHAHQHIIFSQKGKPTQPSTTTTTALFWTLLFFLLPLCLLACLFVKAKMASRLPVRSSGSAAPPVVVKSHKSVRNEARQGRSLPPEVKVCAPHAVEKLQQCKLAPRFLQMCTAVHTCSLVPLLDLVSFLCKVAPTLSPPPLKCTPSLPHSLALDETKNKTKGPVQARIVVTLDQIVWHTREKPRKFTATLAWWGDTQAPTTFR